jgi:hypothetical protein
MVNKLLQVRKWDYEAKSARSDLIVDPRTNQLMVVDLETRTMRRANPARDIEGAPLYTSSGTPVTVDIPTGKDLEAEIIRVAAEAGTHVVYGERCDSIAGLLYLRSIGVRMSDVLEVYKDGIYADPDRTQLRALLADTGIAPLFPVMILDGIAEGFNEAMQDWQALIATTVTVDSGSVEDFQFIDNNNTYQDFILRLLGEGARIPTATLTVSGKTITIYDKGRGLDVSDRAQNASVSLSDTFLRKLGRTLAKFYKTHIVYRAGNGYFEDASDAPTVVRTNGGVGGTTNFPLADILKAMQVLRDRGFTPTDIIGTSNNIINEETSTINGGNLAYVYPNGMDDRLDVQGVWMDDSVDTNELIIMDRNATLVRYELKPFGTEQERTAGQRITSVYATISDEIGMADPMGRVVLSKA